MPDLVLRLRQTFVDQPRKSIADLVVFRLQFVVVGFGVFVHDAIVLFPKQFQAIFLELLELRVAAD